MLIALQIRSFPNCAGGESGGGGAALPTCDPAALPGCGSPWLFWGPTGTAGARGVPRRHFWDEPQNATRGELGNLAHPRGGGVGPLSPAARAPRHRGGVGRCRRHAALRFAARGLGAFPAAPKVPASIAVPCPRPWGGGRGLEWDPRPRGTEGARRFKPPHRGRMRSFAADTRCCFPENRL